MAPINDDLARACASHPSDEKVAAYEAHFAAHKLEANAASLTPLAASIPVYFHVISKDSTTSGGNVP